MGSISTHREKGMTTREYFENEVGLGQGSKILASAVVGGAFYAAVQNAEDATYEPSRVSAMVILITWSSGYFNFTYKDMDEFSGPNESTCPDKILDLLSPIGECHHTETYCKICHNEISDETGVWQSYAGPGQREEMFGVRCAHYLTSEQQADGSAPFHVPGGHGWCSNQSAREWRTRCREYNARVRASKAVQRGDTVIFPAAFNFTGNYRSDTFTYLEKDTFLMFGAHRVRLPGWRGLRTTVIKAST